MTKVWNESIGHGRLRERYRLKWRDGTDMQDLEMRMEDASGSGECWR